MSIKTNKKLNLYYVLIFLVVFFIQCAQFKEMRYLMCIAKGDDFLENGEIYKAKRQYEKAIKIKPYSKEAYNQLGHLYRRELNDTQKAIEVYQKGLKYAPNDYGLNLNIMYAYFDNNEIDKGIKHYITLSKITTEKHRFSFSIDALEKIFKDMNDEEKIAFCKKYLNINPTDLALHETLASIYKRSLDYENWEKQVKAVLKYHYTEQAKKGYYFDLASIYAHYEQYQKALKYFELSKQAGFPVPQEIFDDLEKKIQAKNK
jgi:tetratricopeptide (TPR) repeat protein